MKSLLSDTIRFLEEQYTDQTSWTVPPSQIHLKQTTLPPKKTTPIPQASTFLPPKASPPPLLKAPISKIPAFKEDPLPEPCLVKQEPSLGIDTLSLSVKKLFPHFSIHAEPPKDAEVSLTHKAILQARVAVFSFREGKESDLFLQNIQHAISSHFIKAHVLDAKRWESKESWEFFFKESKAEYIIASPYLYKTSSLLPFLKEIPASSERFLGESRLLLLHPFKQYFDHPLQKKELWQTLCATLKTLLNTPA